MNREIKFRVWDKSLERYAIDYPVEELGSMYDDLNVLFTNGNFIYQQFTGFKDRQEKEIYEGDKVLVDTTVGIVSGIKFKGEIIWSQKNGGWCIKDIENEDGRYTCDLCDFMADECEVII